jgi:hypothetical protein
MKGVVTVPGVVNYARVKFDQPRTYQLLCHERIEQLSFQQAQVFVKA